MNITNDKIQRWRNDIREYEAAQFIKELVNEAEVILNVGPSWGRDYYTLKEQGKCVVNLDIAPQYHLPNTIMGDASKSLPFSDNSFDAVILAEILEHLIEDWIALQETRRILKDNGRLIVTVPFYHDVPIYHVRVHSPKSIVRLLASSGFQIQSIIYRGGLTRVVKLIHGLRKILMPFGLSQQWFRFVINMDRWLGQQVWAHHLAKGVYILAYKSESLNWRGINQKVFAHKRNRSGI